MATAMDNYLREGLNQANSIREFIPDNMADVWKDYTVQYALAQQANENEIANWKMQNEYNTPSAQMARFKEAGLNPMLAYTQGNPGNASSAPGVHTPNVKINPNAEKLARAQLILNSISNITSLLFGMVDQGMNLQMKQNDLDMSNWQNAVAHHYLLGYGSGRKAGQFALLGGVSQGLDPQSKDFDPALFSLLQRLGVSSYATRQITAEANAELAGSRQNYQDIYNEKILPLVEKSLLGKVELQDAEVNIKQYTEEMLNSLPAPVRGLLEPFIRIFMPVLLQSMRNKN